MIPYKVAYKQFKERYFADLFMEYDTMLGAARASGYDRGHLYKIAIKYGLKTPRNGETGRPLP